MPIESLLNAQLHLCRHRRRTGIRGEKFADRHVTCLRILNFFGLALFRYASEKTRLASSPNVHTPE
jgi:hypothetical protein